MGQTEDVPKRLTYTHCMGSWAEQAVQRAFEKERAEKMRLEKEARDATIKDEFGVDRFQQVVEWIEGQITLFNQARGKQELQAGYSHHLPQDRHRLRLLSVFRTDGNTPKLEVEYSPVTHRIRYKCGARTGEYNLSVSTEGQVGFETPGSTPMTIEAVGEALLRTFEGLN